MANSANRNYPLPDPNAVSARADVQNTLDAIIAVDVDVAQLFTDIANAVDQTDIDASVAALKTELQGAAPLTLDQFNELATAINNDPDFYNSIMAVIAGKVSTIDGESPDGSGDVDLSNSYLGKTDTAADSDKLGDVDALDYTRKDLTNLGKTGDVGLGPVITSASQWSDLPVGFGSMMRNSIGTANGAPVDDYGYFLKVANRNAGGGWGGIWSGRNRGESFIGRTDSSGGYATWDKLWDSYNLDPSTLGSEHQESSEFSIVQNGFYSLTHTYGSDITDARAFLICKTAEHGYAVGDKIRLGGDGLRSAHYNNGQAIVGFSDSQAWLTYRADSSTLIVMTTKDGSTHANLTSANWRIIVQAWKE